MSIDFNNSSPAIPVQGKVLPFRVGHWTEAHAETATESQPAERGRHYLKIALPAVPVAVFTLSFIICYVVGISASNGQTIDPLPALLGSLVMTSIIGVLCIAIYIGYLGVTGFGDRQN